MMRRLFLFVAAVIRALPPLRGKVRLGQLFYSLANRAKQPFSIETTLYAERLRFRLNLTSAHERMAFLMNGYESDTVELLDALYSGGTILDIGANIGLIAVPLSVRTANRATSAPHIYAFEALPSNAASLAENVRLNALETRIRVLPRALGSERKQVHIQIEGDDPSRTGTANILPESYDFQKIALEIERLDDIIASGDVPADVSLIKLDTDGYDLEILRGARTLLRERRPLCHVEMNLICHGWHGTTLDDAIAFANELDYDVYVQTAYSSGVFRRYSPELPFFDNMLMIPRENVDVLKRIPMAAS